ncbi:hypothetical protein EZ049_07205 [Enterococcus faecalis]|nr:hypothetical protein [Enterococcus faecalis]
MLVLVPLLFSDIKKARDAYMMAFPTSILLLANRPLHNDFELTTGINGK